MPAERETDLCDLRAAGSQEPEAATLQQVAGAVYGETHL